MPSYFPVFEFARLGEENISGFIAEFTVVQVLNQAFPKSVRSRFGGFGYFFPQKVTEKNRRFVIERKTNLCIEQIECYNQLININWIICHGNPTFGWVKHSQQEDAAPRDGFPRHNVYSEPMQGGGGIAMTEKGLMTRKLHYNSGLQKPFFRRQRYIRVLGCLWD